LYTLRAPAITPRLSFSTSPRQSTDASTVQSARPEPPDHLDEKEKAIFDKLNEALTPIELQVCSTPSVVPNPAMHSILVWCF
jgi:hypothetical protein